MKKIITIVITVLLVVALLELGMVKTASAPQVDVIEFDKSKVEATEQSNAVEEVLKPNPRTVIPLNNLGTFKITAYCGCSKCCGKSDGITASGVKATAGRTIAVDTNIIPFGTKVIIDGYEYVAEDRGGSIIGNRIDIFMESHAEAINFGVQYKEVFAG